MCACAGRRYARVNNNDIGSNIAKSPRELSKHNVGGHSVLVTFTEIDHLWSQNDIVMLRSSSKTESYSHINPPISHYNHDGNRWLILYPNETRQH